MVASNPTRGHVRVDRLEYQCPTHKKGYPTRELALDGCEHAMDLGMVQPGCHLTPYKCPDCSGWHITNRRIVFVAPEDLSRRDFRRRKD